MNPGMKAAIAGLLAAGLVQPVLAAGNAQRGKVKAEQVCAACHSVDGSKPVAPDQPILAGQHYDYLVRALRDYKSGARNNVVMKSMADPLSRQDIEDVSAWYASQPAKLQSRR
jgi:cytochrome c553